MALVPYQQRDVVAQLADLVVDTVNGVATAPVALLRALYRSATYKEPPHGSDEFYDNVDNARSWIGLRPVNRTSVRQPLMIGAPPKVTATRMGLPAAYYGGSYRRRYRRFKRRYRRFRSRGLARFYRLRRRGQTAGGYFVRKSYF